MIQTSYIAMDGVTPETASPRMRTAKGALEELKAMDPGTEVTLNYLRRIIRTETIPVLSVGVKKLVDMTILLEFLKAGTQADGPAFGGVL